MPLPLSRQLQCPLPQRFHLLQCVGSPSGCVSKGCRALGLAKPVLCCIGDVGPLARMSPEPPTIDMVFAKYHNKSSFIVVYADWHYAALLENFICSIRRLALDNRVHFFCFTDDLAAHLIDHFQVSAFVMDEYRNLTNDRANHHSSVAFKKLTVSKFYIMQKLLRLGHSVLFMDCDVVLIDDPFLHVQQHPQVDMLFQREVLYGCKHGCPNTSTFPENSCNVAPNTGIFFARPTTRMLKALAELMQVSKRMVKHKNDQDIVVWYLSRGTAKDAQCEPCTSDALCYRHLGAGLFPNNYVIQYYRPALQIALQALQRTNPVLVHMNSKQGAPKARRFKRLGLWMIDGGQCANVTPNVLQSIATDFRKRNG